MLRAGPARKRARGPSPRWEARPGGRHFEPPPYKGGPPPTARGAKGLVEFGSVGAPPCMGAGPRPPPDGGGSKVVAPPAGGDLSTICSKDCMLGAMLLKYDTVVIFDTLLGALSFEVSRLGCLS